MKWIFFSYFTVWNQSKLKIQETINKNTFRFMQFAFESHEQKYLWKTGSLKTFPPLFNPFRYST